MKVSHWIYATVVVVLASCSSSRKATSVKDDNKIEITFVQVNDVYEISPIAGGKEGGMARVATLRKEELKKNPNTLLVMGGDFLSPSVYNSLKYKGERVRGAQMVEAMNAAGLDIAVFGNHEFDITENELQSRINESKFDWVSTNTFHKVKDSVLPFRKVSASKVSSFPKTMVRTFTDADGTTAKIGFIGLTLSSNPAPFVSYTNPFAAAKEAYESLRDSVDQVVAITHQAIVDDIKLAQELPNLAAILGGHEHSMILNKVGKVVITKAHSNARSAYVVKLLIDKSNHSSKTTPELRYLNQSVALDSSTNEIVQKWKKIAEDNYATIGFDPRKILIAAGDTLDGRETEVRTGSTNLTRLVTGAIAFACPQADVVMFNSGSIRLDDVLPPPVSQYDVIRSMPFGGGIREVDMKGNMLIDVLRAGMANSNNGGYLQTQPVTFNSTANHFMLKGQPLDPNKIYRVALTDFLLTGKEANLAFLNESNPDIIKTYPAETSVQDPRSDVRLAVIRYIEAGHNKF